MAPNKHKPCREWLELAPPSADIRSTIQATKKRRLAAQRSAAAEVEVLGSQEHELGDAAFG
eukprot:13711711-Alexandrium_andersonii.AAC.1